MKADLKTKIVRFVLVMVVLTAAIPTSLLVTWRLWQTPEYTNMTDGASGAQVDRAIAEDNAACKEQGGWGYAMGSGGCIPLYDKFQPPEHPWFVMPIPNPWNFWAEMAGAFMVVMAICILIVLPMVPLGFWPWRKENL